MSTMTAGMAGDSEKWPDGLCLSAMTRMINPIRLWLTSHSLMDFSEWISRLYGMTLTGISGLGQKGDWIGSKKLGGTRLKVDDVNTLIGGQAVGNLMHRGRHLKQQVDWHKMETDYSGSTRMMYLLLITCRRTAAFFPTRFFPSGMTAPLMSYGSERIKVSTNSISTDRNRIRKKPISMSTQIRLKLGTNHRSLSQIFKPKSHVYIYTFGGDPVNELIADIIGTPWSIQGMEWLEF